MLLFIDFVYSYMIGIIQDLIEYHFFVKFIDKKPKIAHYLLFAVIGNFIVTFIQGSILLKLILYIILLLGMGIFFYKANGIITALYAVITIEIMQICYGIFNSVSGILSPLLYPIYPDITGELFMISNNLLALLLSFFCYCIIYKYFSYFETEKNQYVLMILTPLFMMLLLNEYINQTVYGSTIIINRSGRMLNVNNSQILVIQLFSIFSIFCIIYGYKKLAYSFKVSAALTSLEQERHYQNQYVSEAKSRYEKTQSFRHDVKNHLSIIHGLLEKGNISEAEKYLESMEILTNDLSLPYHTGNPVLDILIGNKLGLANKKGITVSCSLELFYPCHVTDIDFCIILSNALDNAIHACEMETKDQEKYIQISGRRQGDFFFIEIKNSYHGKKIYKMGTGLSNIKSICEKYNGAISISSQNGSFCLSVLLIISQHSESISQQIY